MCYTRLKSYKSGRVAARNIKNCPSVKRETEKQKISCDKMLRIVLVTPHFRKKRKLWQC